ncbi:MAG: AtpZ/AtpI family protein [Elusimicrobiota bacterium]
MEENNKKVVPKISLNRFQDKNLWQASLLGTNLAVSIAVGFGIGYWLDKLFNTPPWLMILFFFLGIAAGFWQIIKFMVKKQNNVKNNTYKNTNN